FSSRRRHTRFSRDWSSDVCSSDLCRGFDKSFHEVPPALVHDPPGRARKNPGGVKNDFPGSNLRFGADDRVGTGNLDQAGSCGEGGMTLHLLRHVSIRLIRMDCGAIGFEIKRHQSLSDKLVSIRLSYLHPDFNGTLPP